MILKNIKKILAIRILWCYTIMRTRYECVRNCRFKSKLREEDFQ